MNLILTAVLVIQAQNIMVHFFYAPDCGHCMDILLEDIPKLQKKYHFVLKKYDINILENEKLLEKMEENIIDKSEDLPVIFIADSVFYGPKESREKLARTLKAVAQEVKPIIRDTNRVVIDTASINTAEIYLYYFYQPGCRECSRTDILLKNLEKYYAFLKVYRLNVFEDTNKIFYEALAERLAMQQEKRLTVPTIFIGDDYLVQDSITLGNIDFLIKKYQKGSPKLDTLNIQSGASYILERFARFSFLGVMVAGLLDGLNPCAFATLIFFVSYLLVIGRRQRDIILMAVFFILSIFIIYFAIGFGAYKLINYLSRFSFAAKVIFIGFGGLAIVLGILSIRDYFLARRGDFKKMILQLPPAIKRRIHKDIQEKTAIGGIIIGSLIAGFFVSLLEFGCTGQVYLPTITFMTSRAGLSVKPLLALFAYNVMFVIPLIAVAILATIISTEKIYRSFAARVPLVKLLTAILFLVLGSLLLILA